MKKEFFKEIAEQANRMMQDNVNAFKETCKKCKGYMYIPLEIEYDDKKVDLTWLADSPDKVEGKIYSTITITDIYSIYDKENNDVTINVSYSDRPFADTAHKYIKNINELKLSDQFETITNAMKVVELYPQMIKVA